MGYRDVTQFVCCIVLEAKQPNGGLVWLFFLHYPQSILTCWILTIVHSIRCENHYQINFDVGFSALLITEYQQEKDRLELCYVASSVVKL